MPLKANEQALYIDPKDITDIFLTIHNVAVDSYEFNWVLMKSAHMLCTNTFHDEKHGLYCKRAAHPKSVKHDNNNSNSHNTLIIIDALHQHAFSKRCNAGVTESRKFFLIKEKKKTSIIYELRGT